MRPHLLYLAVSCRPPRGAWAFRHVTPEGPFGDVTGTEAHASTYRLRLHALVNGLEAQADGAHVEVRTTDPQLIRVVTEWLPAWVRNDFAKRDAADLLRRLPPQLARLQVDFAHLEKRTGDPHAKDNSRRAKAAADAMDVTVPPPSQRVTVRDDVQVVAWTDGGCRKNPGPGGWGVVLVHLGTGTTLLRCGGGPEVTNNRMELTAIAEALDAFSRRVRVEVRTDSRFAIDALSKWMPGWKRRGWKKKDGEPPTNLDVFQRLDGLLQRHDVVFTWVRGHSGEPGNERADALCNQAMDALQAGRDPSYEERADEPPFDVVTG